MSKFKKSFAGGNPLKADELNQMAAAINDNDDRISSLREKTNTKLTELDSEAIKSNGKSYVFSTSITGSSLRWEIPIIIPNGLYVSMIATGLDNVVESGLTNLYLYDSDNNLAISSNLSNNVKNTIYVSTDIVKVVIQRGSTIGTGNISINIDILSILDSRIKQDIGDSETDIMSQKSITDLLSKTIKYTPQTLDNLEQLQARKNIGAINEDDVAALLNGKENEFEITDVNWVNGYYSGYDLTPKGNGWASQKIDVSQYAGKSIRVYRNVQSSTARYTYITNSQGQIITYYAEELYNNIADNGMYYGDITIPDDGVGLYISMAINATERKVCVISQEKGLLNQLGQSPIYVNPTTGNDDNDGSMSSPVKTINKAIELGSYIVLRGGLYKESIILDDYQYKNVAIVGYPSEKIIAEPSVNIIVNDGSEELVSGYTKVYRVPMATNPLNSLTNGRLYQDNIEDVNTLIADIDRHPLHRGLAYRCDSTLIKQCSSINDIEELENGYGYYYSDGYMYFSRPKQSSANNPIIAPVIGQSFIKLSKDRGLKNQLSVYIDNIEVRYANVHIGYTSSVKISNVRVKYPIVNDGGGFYLYNVVDFILNKCEACGVTDGKTYGDGFNMHTSATDTDKEVLLQGRIVDCWSHDNYDDGYSDHENSEMTIDGGLFEFNGKGGITPSYGANDVILNAVSRYNDNGSVSNGIYVTGSPISNRKSTTALAINCVCYGNKFAFRSQHEGCVLTLIKCISYNSDWGTFRADSGKIYAIGCKQGGEYSVEGNVSKMSLTDL